MDTKSVLIEIECSEQMRIILEGLVKTGLFGPSIDTAAQRLLEMKLWDMANALPRKEAV